MKLITLTGNKGTRTHLGGASERKALPIIPKSLFGIVCMVMLMIAPFNLMGQNIQGVAPTQTPLGGYAVDGNAYVKLLSPSEPGGDLFFERGTTDNTANPGGLFRADYFQNPPISLGNGIFTDLTNPDLFVHPNTFLFRDDITNMDPTIFTSSNKINDNPNSYTWGSGSSPNKNEIQSAIAHFTFGETSLGGDPDDLWMIFAADREVTNGSSYIDFEILQNTLTKTGSTSGGFQSAGPDGGRTVGDILVTIEFTQGGGEATAVIRRWEPSGSGFIYNVYTSFPAGSIFISNNTVATIVPYSIYNQNPLSSGVFEGYYQYSLNQWAEGAVNISALFDQEDPCLQISTLFVRTRTSGSSGQSELKDFPIGPIQLSLDLTPDPPVVADVDNCGPWEGTLEATECEGTVSWYAEQTDETPLHTGASFDPGEITETTSFWVSCTVDECEGPRVEVIITIIDNPDLDSIDDVTACDSYDLPAVGTISGTNLVSPKYFDDSQANGGVEITDLTLTSSQTVWVYDETDSDPNCSDEISFMVEINDTPELDPINDVTACDSYDLPAVSEISGTNLVSPKYYDDSQANGGSVITDLTLTSSQTVWVYDETNTDPNCSDEISFIVEINDTPELDPIGNVTVCDSYDLPPVGEISGTNLVSPKYYDDSQANGGSEITDLTLTSDQTVWVYDETGTDPNCYDEISFMVTINGTPELDPIDDVTACDSFDLPAVSEISGTNLVSPKYYDDSQANGGAEITDLTLTSSQTVWVYDETGSTPNCYDEISFDVDISDSPDLDPIGDITECDSYDLPAVGTIGGTNLVSPKYFDDSQANGGVEITNLTLTSSQTVWVYDETGTTPNCFDEISFMVNINDTPQISTTDPEPICVGESVDLANHVLNPDGGDLSYHSSLADAEAGSNALASSVVSPALGSHPYYVRSENSSDSDCYSTALITVEVITCRTGEGCTLGYWKNHTDRWCDAYSTCTLYGDVFSSAPNPSNGNKLNIYNLTLQEVLNLGGNSAGENLARQSVAALLNTCSSEVGFEYHSVIALVNDVNAAWDGNPNGIKTFANYLDGLNNSYCPLGGSSATEAPSPECVDALKQASMTSATESDPLLNETSIVVNSFSVSPVPFRESLSVQYDFDYISDATIQMFDLQGRLLFTHKEANASKGKITDLSFNFRILPSQIYVVTVTTDRDVFIKKIVSDK